MKDLIIKNATIVNNGLQFVGSVQVRGEFIVAVYEGLVPPAVEADCNILDATGKVLMPGVIDDQVHFREPGLTEKANIYTESRAAVAGGVTTFMDMPNVKPQTTTQALLAERYDIAAASSAANYSFYMGATNDNLDELLKTDPRTVCGIKVFMGSSTGNMLVDNEDTLSGIFSSTTLPVAVHCEHEPTVQHNTQLFTQKYAGNIPFSAHPDIRSAEACYRSSAFAVDLAHKHGTRLHVLHLSTARELSLFDHTLPAERKKITAEVCVHHLWFDSAQYDTLGSRIKWNPAIKTAADREALFGGMLSGKIDVIATDHAPHLWSEKQNPYASCPSGGPLVQHSLVAMLEFYHKNAITLPQIVEKMCHAPAKIFNIEKRGYIAPGYYADLVLVDTNSEWTVSAENILYKCAWSPFEGQAFRSRVTNTFVNGQQVYNNGTFDDTVRGKRILFAR